LNHDSIDAGDAFVARNDELVPQAQRCRSFRTSSADSRKDGVVNPKHDAISTRNGVDVRSNDFAA
jgi:hypothetical protein